jgi:hypothetical protein
MRSLRVVALMLIVLVFAAPLWSQTGTSTIRGTITDPQDRVVGNATVTVTNVATNAVRTTQSTDTGSYVFDLITPADYRLEVEAKGFKKKVVENVRALIGNQTETNVQLEVGAANEVVEVTGGEVLINTQDATLGNNFISEQITQLPLEARNLVDLLSLQPGATREGYVTGARADQANVTLDGVDINNAQTGNAERPRQTNNLLIGVLDTDRGNITTGPVLRLNSEAIEEFRVTTANGNANQGRSSGSQVNLVTKSGTNAWHGAGFEFYRSRGFTANDWFNNHATDSNGNWAPVPRTPLVRNTFGGAMGGPMVKNKAFFFYSYEGRHDASGQSVVRTVPLANLGQGTINYEYCTDASCSSIQQFSLDVTQNEAAFKSVHNADPANPAINPVALAALAAAAQKYPANDTTTGDQLNTGGFRFNAPTPTRLNSHVGKLDFNLTNNQTAFVRANVIYDHQTLPQWLPGAPSPLVWSHPWGLAAGHTWIISNNWVNNFRYGYTRQSFSNIGDSNGNDTDFRFVFQPTGETHSVSRVTPVQNFTDDVSWIHGNHNVQFGVNVRRINNDRVSFANAFDFAETNPSFYLNTGANIPSAFQAYLNSQGLPGAGGLLSSSLQVRNAGTAIIGRFTELTSNFTFGKDGTLLSAGSPTVRDFATQAYDEYIQDTWKVRPNLTLTLGLRYSLERPVYETQGFEVQPTVPLGQYFAKRVAAGIAGTNFVDPIVINRSGPVNGGKPLYNWDKNNFQPRIAAAWSGDGGKTVLRGGFALTNDYYGQALAVDWDLNNTLGFTSNFTNHANTFDIGAPFSSKPVGPLFTGFGQDVRSLIGTAGGSVPGGLQFPLSASVLNGDTEFGERIESGLDSDLHAPTQYVWNFTFERTLPKGAVVSASYIGRMGRSLLLHRDAVAFNNLHDPKTGLDWFTAGTALEKLRQQGVDITQIPPTQISSVLPANVSQYFDHMFPSGLASIIEGYDGLVLPCDPNCTNAQAFMTYQANSFFEANDWTDVQAEMDLALAFNGFPIRFMQPQYGFLSAWSTIGNANYHALAISLRQRIKSLTFDLNYTWAHSLDDASGLQTEDFQGNFQGNGSVIVSPLRQRENYASSDFDVRHNINAAAVWQMPFGKGRALLSGAGRGLDAVFGGWQISGIFRWNTGLPAISAIDDGRWATNWDFQSNVTPIKPIHSCPNKPVQGTPNLFGGCNITQIYQNFRNAYPGESGPRNYLRYPGYIDLDLGLGKSWKMPWNEGHQLQLRWDVFNVTNTQHLIGNSNDGVEADPGLNGATPPSDFYNLTQIQGQARIMQVGVRYSF